MAWLKALRIICLQETFQKSQLAENQSRVKVVLEVLQFHQINTRQVLVQQATVTWSDKLLLPFIHPKYHLNEQNLTDFCWNIRGFFMPWTSVLGDNSNSNFCIFLKEHRWTPQTHVLESILFSSCLVIAQCQFLSGFNWRASHSYCSIYPSEFPYLQSSAFIGLRAKQAASHWCLHLSIVF